MFLLFVFDFMFLSVAFKKSLNIFKLVYPLLTEQYPCGVCKLEVNDHDDTIQCDLCDRWNHVNCVEINKRKYEKLKKDPLPWYCPAGMSEIMERHSCLLRSFQFIG